MSTKEKALKFATKHHAGQVDKCGVDYILHPIAVAKLVGEAGYGDTHQIVALLHDVVEDCPATLDDLRAEGYSEEIVAAVDAVSRRKGEGYSESNRDYFARVMMNEIAMIVKVADLTHNSSPDREHGDRKTWERHVEWMERLRNDVEDAQATGVIHWQGRPRPDLAQKSA